MAQSGGHAGADVAEEVMGSGGWVCVAGGPGVLLCRGGTANPATAPRGQDGHFLSFT